MPLIRVADEVWIAAALLHRRYPEREDFTVGEIVERAREERVTGLAEARPGVQSHAYLHCVANRPPNPGRYRMLVETSRGRRRLFRPGDPCHPLRAAGKDVPEARAVPAPYRGLIDWYRRDYAGGGADGAADPVLALRGAGGGMAGGDPDAWLARSRRGGP